MIVVISSKHESRGLSQDDKNIIGKLLFSEHKFTFFLIPECLAKILIAVAGKLNIEPN
jgi:hypothetical protein